MEGEIRIFSISRKFELKLISIGAPRTESIKFTNNEYNVLPPPTIHTFVRNSIFSKYILFF